LARTLVLAAALGVTIAAGGARAQVAPTAHPSSSGPNPVAAISVGPSIAVIALYSWGGLRLGTRCEWPVLTLKDLQFKNDVLAVGGVEYFTQSYDSFIRFRRERCSCCRRAGPPGWTCRGSLMINRWGSYAV
jgi:hypothetical protein